jgi:hypothetical protein
MVHHLLAPSLLRNARRQIDGRPAPADCTQLRLWNYKFAEDGADERHGVRGFEVAREGDHALIGIEGRKGIR